MRVLIVEDNQIASYALKSLIENSFNKLFNSVETAESYIESKQKIENLKPDLVFLDLTLNGEDGFGLIKYKQIHPFETVIITTDDKKAYNAIKYQVLDYLIKPVLVEDLSNSIQKFIMKKIHQAQTQLVEKVKLVTPNGLVIVEHNDIVFCEAIGNNSKIFFSKGHYSIISKPLIDLEKQLSLFRFFRIHKSYLINLNHLVEYSKTEGGYVVLKHYESVRVPVSKNSRESLINLL